MRDFEKIIAWQKAHAFGVLLDELDARPFRRRPGLRTQLYKAADSISANISEGAGKATPADFAHYLHNALGTTRETRNHILKARDTRCIDAAMASRLLSDLDEVGRLIYAYAKAVSADEGEQTNRVRGRGSCGCGCSCGCS